MWLLVVKKELTFTGAGDFWCFEFFREGKGCDRITNIRSIFIVFSADRNPFYGLFGFAQPFSEIFCFECVAAISFVRKTIGVSRFQHS
jgi:hypothetical protein